MFPVFTCHAELALVNSLSLQEGNTSLDSKCFNLTDVHYTQTLAHM